MKLHTKLATITVTAIVGGLGLAQAAGYSASTILSPTDNSTAQVQPQDATAPSDGASSVATGTVTQSTDPVTQGTSDSQPSNPAATPAVKPAPKPAVIYSDHPSAETPCRMFTENTYTNDCVVNAPADQPAAASPDATAPIIDTTPVVDPSTIVVTNPNQ